jgi:hypothetical protein
MANRRPLLNRMSLLQACHALVPVYLCRHLDIALYLVPSLALAAAIWLLGRRYDSSILFYLAGTICHELAHYCVGLITLARPTSFTVIPRRTRREWTLGSVEFANLRWYNAAPTALAPFLILAIPLAVAAVRVAHPWSFGWADLAIAFLLAPQFLCCWPSRQDWLLAVASWPYLALAAGGYFLFMQYGA